MSPIPIYQLALFVHILGAFGLIAAITLEASAQWGLRRAATAEEARARLAGVRVIQRLAPASLGSILLTGLYMMAVAWGPKGWIVAAFAGLLMIGLIGGLVTGVRMARLGHGLDPDVPRSVVDGRPHPRRHPCRMWTLTCSPVRRAAATPDP